jgi:hypothetical protein
VRIKNSVYKTRIYARGSEKKSERKRSNMLDLVGLSILVILAIILIRQDTPRRPKSEDERFLQAVKIKPWKEGR